MFFKFKTKGKASLANFSRSSKNIIETVRFLIQIYFLSLWDFDFKSYPILIVSLYQVDTWLEASLRMREMAACAIHRPDCFGYLSKQQEHARKTSSPTGWSRRYCVLKDAALYFYDDANAEKAFGVACLHGFRVHGSAPTSGGRKHAFELQPPDPTQRSYIFATESEMDKKR